MKKQKIVACSAILLLFFGFGLGYMLNKGESKKQQGGGNDTTVKNIEERKYEGNPIYIITGDYDGDYQLEDVNLYSFLVGENEGLSSSRKDYFIDSFNTTEIMTYDEYKEYMSNFNLKTKYKDKDKKYLVIAQANRGSTYVKVRVADVLFKRNTVHVYMYERFGGVTADIAGYVLVIPVEENIKDYVIATTYTREEYKNLKKYGQISDPGRLVSEKPMIYIYPEEEMDVNVKLGNPEILTTTYPKYNDGWNVRAYSDSTLKYNGREYYGLYWEGSNKGAIVQDEGFVVKGEDVEPFLEEKLAILGLNEREANEFIVYWLPRLEHNKYNYIRFETMNEIDSYMPLYVTPEPDSVIRVIMEFKGLDEEIDVKEQRLKEPLRTGYTVVEWGGIEIR